jgi:hypothetical protein
MPSNVRGPQFVFRISKNKDLMSALQTALIFAVYMIISVGLMCYLERDWTNIDGAYFAIATVATVGYGDIAPTSDGSRWVAIFMIVFGITIVFSAVAGVIAHGLAPITKYGRALMEKALPRQGVDLDGDGGFDFYIPRAAPIYYAQNLLPAIVLFFAIQMASAGIFVAIDPSNTFGKWMYHCIVTSTTVGYGDVPNATQYGRLWSCFHILISVAMLGEVITNIGELRAQRHDMLQRVRAFMMQVDGPMLDRLIEYAKKLRPLVTRDDLGLTELEFILTMMIDLKVVEIDKMTPFVKQFRLFEVDGDARLSHADVVAAAKMDPKKLREGMKARLKNSTMQSVGARMGLSVYGGAITKAKLDQAEAYEAILVKEVEKLELALQAKKTKGPFR